MPKVLITDSLSDLGLNILKEVAEVNYAPNLSKDKIIEIIADYDALLIRSGTQVDKDIINACSASMKIIGRAGVGVDNIDVSAATQKGIIIVNSPDGNTTAAAEHTVSMMLSLARLIPLADNSMKKGEWNRSKFLGVELNKKVLGVVGLGKIGTKVCQIAQAIGMKILGYDPLISPDRAKNLNIKLVSLDEIWSESDFITLHLPKTAETVNLINKETLSKMKPELRLVNCARGGIINEADLAEALKNGIIAGAALDVFDHEPLEGNSPLRELKDKIILTPHLGASTEEAQINVAVDVAEQIKEVLQGGFARSAVNLPGFRGLLIDELKPSLELSLILGSFIEQFCGSARPIELIIELKGNLTKKQIEPLVLAVTKGFLSNKLENISFVNAKLIAQEKGLNIIESKSSEESDYAEEMILHLKTDKGDFLIAGTLHNNKLPVITRLNDYNFFAIPSKYMLLTLHQDKPGTIARISGLLGNNGINISGMNLGRKSEKEEALMICSLDEAIPKDILSQIKQLDGIEKATCILI